MLFLLMCYAHAEVCCLAICAPHLGFGTPGHFRQAPAPVWVHASDYFRFSCAVAVLVSSACPP